MVKDRQLARGTARVCGKTDRLSFAIAVEPEDEQVAVASQRLELTRKLLK